MDWFTLLQQKGLDPQTGSASIGMSPAAPVNGTSGSSGVSGSSGSSGVDGKNGSSGSSGSSGISSASVVEQTCNPARFGAKPNVQTLEAAISNTVAFRECQKTYGKIDPAPGEFFFANDIRVSSGLKVNGAGVDSTILSVLPNNPDVENRGKNNEWFSLFNTNTGASSRIGDVTGIPFGDSNNVEISNLTINGNYNKQKQDSQGRYNTTVQSIFLQGSNNKVTNVKSIGCARGLGGGECFQIRLTFGPNTVGDKGGEITGCEVTNVGYAQGTHRGGGGYEISCLTVSGYGSKLAKGVKIKNNIVRDIPVIEGQQKSAINSISCSASEGAVIEGNIVQNVDGNGFYVDSWSNNGMFIKNNSFYKVFTGIFLNAYGDAYNPVTLNMNDLVITNNDIILRSDTPSQVKVEKPFSGIIINSPTYTEKQFFNNVIIAKNIIYGVGAIMGNAFPEPYFSRGVYCILNHSKQYAKVKITQNLIDTPDTKPNNAWYPEPGCLSLYYYASYDTLTPEMTFKNNYNSDGKLLKAMVCRTDGTLNRWA